MGSTLALALVLVGIVHSSGREMRYQLNCKLCRWRMGCEVVFRWVGGKVTGGDEVVCFKISKEGKNTATKFNRYKVETQNVLNANVVTLEFE